jgi:hypothetical protein
VGEAGDKVGDEPLEGTVLQVLQRLPALVKMESASSRACCFDTTILRRGPPSVVDRQVNNGFTGGDEQV